ncbi:MAG: hypothetical protein IJ692_03270 [Alloprevotella sp.]|nr:hypothetical protein [Alloprevotella sp.]MBR1652394.1 hypothetical protein [Alloprevotella sp.]
MEERMDQNREWAEEAFWTGHCHYLLQALAIAIARCRVWRLAATGDVFTLIEILDFAKAYDAEHPLPEGQFYRVTREGAIGLCLGVEYVTQWLFTPMEPGAERDALLKELDEKMEEMEMQDLMPSVPVAPAAPVAPAPPAEEEDDDAAGMPAVPMA